MKNLAYPLVLLAGGRSERMGVPKGLLAIDEQTWLETQLLKFRDSGGEHAVVGLGHHHERYYEKLPWLKEAIDCPVYWHGLKITAALNPKPERGQFSTLQRALATVDVNVKRVFVTPIDNPLPPANDLRSISESFDKNTLASIPHHMGSGVHPVLISTDLIRDILQTDESSRLDYLLDELPKRNVTRPEISIRSRNLNTVSEWDVYLRQR